MDVHTPQQRSNNMRAIKGKNTKIELLLGRALWSNGIRYRKNVKTVLGTPDFAMKGLKIAIFCDSEFFHGKDWEKQKLRIKTNSEFWIKKIETNMARDLKVNKELISNGWSVIRFWGNDIKKNIEECVNTVKNEIIIKKATLKN
jgi:DNA mismatch endonuclease (patch repair protein)